MQNDYCFVNLCGFEFFFFLQNVWYAVKYNSISQNQPASYLFKLYSAKSSYSLFQTTTTPISYLSLIR